jgi:hypothetical protein
LTYKILIPNLFLFDDLQATNKACSLMSDNHDLPEVALSDFLANGEI